MNKVSDGATHDELRGIQFAFGRHQIDDNARMLTERVLAPLLDYLSERVGRDSNLLYVLERYVRRVEWFERERLFTEYKAMQSTGEKVYDRDLRKFLFSEGINMPFSQASSASGLSDVLTDLDGDDPLVCEVKLFTGDKRGVSAGVNQVVHYAQDHSKSSAYLVIINLTGRPLQLPSDGPEGVLPRYLDLSGVRTYLIPVRALPQESASKLGTATPVIFTRENFIEPDSA